MRGIKGWHVLAWALWTLAVLAGAQYTAERKGECRGAAVTSRRAGGLMWRCVDQQPTGAPIRSRTGTDPHR